ncbi:fibronectin type III domain-containing protein [Patescibacteria group bacterium]
MKTNKLRKNKTVLKKATVIVVLVLVAIAAVIGGWLIWRSFFSQAGTELPKAELTLDPATGSYDVDQEFTVDINIDTKGGKVPNAAAYLEFNKGVFEVVKVEPNTEDQNGTDAIFEKSWAPTTSKAIKAANTQSNSLDTRGWIVVAGMTGNISEDEASKKAIDEGTSAPELGTTPQTDWFQGTGKLATITLKGKKDATSKVNFNEGKSAVMYTFGTGVDNIGQPKDNPVDILAVVNSGTYTIGDGGAETPAPYDLTAVGGNKKVDLNWKYNDTSKDANTTYNLYRAEVAKTLVGDSDTGFTKIKSGLTDKNYTDTDVVNGHTYEYYVTAISGTIESEPSNHAIATPSEGGEGEIPAPTNLIAIGGDKRVGLSWNYASISADLKFRVYRALKDGGNYEQIAEGTATAYTDTDVTNGTTYLYYVTAVVSGQESGPSNIAEATPSAGGGVLHADIAYNDGEGNAVYGRDNKVDYFDYAFLMNVVWGKDPSNWKDPNVDFAKIDGGGNVVLGSDGEVNYAEYAYMLNVEWGMTIGGGDSGGVGNTQSQEQGPSEFFVEEYWANSGDSGPTKFYQSEYWAN